MQKNQRAAIRRNDNPKPFTNKNQPKPNIDDGPFSCEPDLSENDYIIERNIHLAEILRNHANKLDIEKVTNTQSQCIACGTA